MKIYYNAAERDPFVGIISNFSIVSSGPNNNGPEQNEDVCLNLLLKFSENANIFSNDPLIRSIVDASNQGFGVTFGVTNFVL